MSTFTLPDAPSLDDLHVFDFLVRRLGDNRQLHRVLTAADSSHLDVEHLRVEELRDLARADEKRRVLIEEARPMLVLAGGGLLVRYHGDRAHHLAPLDDTYGLCITRDESSKLSGLKISDLVKELSQLPLATSTDIAKNVVPQLQATYGLSFQVVTTYPQENAALAALSAGTQKLAMCHTTNPLIVSDKLALLQDDKNAFASNNPAPIVRDSLLRQVPQIMTVLNKLAPYLTTEVSQQLQAQVIDGKQSVNTVASRFLQSKGLL